MTLHTNIIIDLITSDSTNGSHPLRFYLEADKSTAYTTGVTTNGSPQVVLVHIRK